MDRHERYRELVSDRLVGPLDPASEQRLRRHLADCPRCRMVEREYIRERGLLNALPERPPPRDLWARTSAALDRELVRRPRGRRGRRDEDRPARQGSPALMLAALASFVVAVAVVGTQLGTVPRPVETAVDTQAPAPTPFDVPTQELAFVEFTPDGLAIYAATVDRACPPAAPDCAVITAARHSVVMVPGELSAGDLDLHGPNGRLALLTADGDGNDTVSVVFLPPSDDIVPGATARPPTGPVDPSATTTPGGPSSGATDPSRSADPTRRPPTPSPLDAPPTDRRPSGDTGTPSVPSEPADATPPDEPTQSLHAIDPSEASGTPVPAAVHAVLEDVHVVGAPPAWSGDGEQLAFSAMPADRSRGPDVYRWRLGDARAQRLTSDHRSYFASWAGDRIVVSRAVRAPEAADETLVVAATYLIEPSTGEQRQAEAGGAWLPSVDPTGRFAIVWMGTMALSARNLAPLKGALYVIDWRKVDPFRDSGSDAAGDDRAPDGVPPPDGPGNGPLPDGTPRDKGPAGPAGDGAGDDGTDGGGDDGTDSDSERSAAPTEDAGEADAARPAKRPRDRRGDDSRPANGSGEETTPGPSPSPPAEESLRPVPLEPQRDEDVHPVREWRISWSEDGSAFGFWVSERPGDTWGQLAVYLVDGTGGSVERGATVLEATLARRAFTLGRERVAWIAPSAQRADGELRVRTWGSRGYGGLRFPDIDVSSGLPAF